jgi:hypothetical protein
LAGAVQRAARAGDRLQERRVLLEAEHAGVLTRPTTVTRLAMYCSTLRVTGHAGVELAERLGDRRRGVLAREAGDAHRARDGDRDRAVGSDELDPESSGFSQTCTATWSPSPSL